MATKIIELDPVSPGQPWWLMANPRRPDATTRNKQAIVQADLAGSTIPWVSYRVNADGTRTQVDSGTFAKGDAILDTPSSGDAWGKGGTFNLWGAMPATSVPEGGEIYLVSVTYTLTGGDSFEDWYLVPTLDVPT